MKMYLTRELLDNLQVPSGDTVIRDTECTGLSVRYGKQLKLVWRVDIRIKGVRVSQKIGTYPKMSIEEARSATLWQLDLSLGNSKEKTLQDVLKLYRAVKPRAVGTEAGREKLFEKFLDPDLRGRPMFSMTESDVRSIVTAEIERFKSGQAEKIIRSARPIWRFAVDRGYVNKGHLYF